VPHTEHGSRRVAVVTGGAGAIGGAIAARLAPDHTVVVLDRTGDVVVDLGDPDDVRRAAELVLLRSGMRDRGFGRVIFIVSNTFWRPPGAHMLAYVASKGALIGMVRTLAVGLGSDGVAVTAVSPGLTHTPATDVVPAAEFADVEAHQALPRPLTPEDTAAVVAMLAGDDAAALTGQTLTVDGGLVLR
jgi:NAD(P)-dependent dehydrogenase (short-subunit alcohol dehydrogenase family)